ncbi:hypothetical protein CPB85DRAFT_1439210 [Mucidula mucida]|nr:hypothetical protein CPB85DRAFT_1439210 [Mucidula mucida]
MEYDRKSTVSSFYGRKSSDALNNDYPAPSSQYTGARPRDDASSFFGGPPTGTAGYNRGSFFHAGREEPLKGGDEEQGEGGFDIYADFNNAGPKYSSGFTGYSSNQAHEYRPLGPSTPKLMDDTASASGPVELITVPALGPEWKKDELRDMTKAGRKEKKYESRRGKWTAWKRGERGICGKYFTRRFTAFFLFGLCVCIGIVLAFTIPRVPSFTINNDSPLANATGDWEKKVDTYFNRAPANFSFPAFADLEVYTGSNYLPLTFSHVYAEVYDLNTNRQVASGDLGHKTIPAKTFTQLLLPLNFTYVASNDSDTTWNNWYNGCKNVAATTTGVRDSVKFRLDLEMHIDGLIGAHRASTQVNSASCPIELSLNSA